ncbi:ATP-binding protein [Streptomyces sp. TRM S81-3]|uniref:ATP-binding protein n=1 Tax=Streptomyces griseicoloratus TaxID=2752516 RepID=A0A926QUL1_9ACTN|nr:ATP-binding protein [Streptomyces griseicoloratus]MBD0423202.1 ATP-binding protein [Streptomyces griseicoloratus]
MKQSAAKTLGVAALGAAFAAAGAGAANAAPAVPDAAQTLDTVARTLPAEGVSQVAPEAGNALEGGRGVAGEGLTTVQPVAEQLADPAADPAAADPITKLLGGLPVKSLLGR